MAFCSTCVYVYNVSILSNMNTSSRTDTINDTADNFVNEKMALVAQCMTTQPRERDRKHGSARFVDKRARKIGEHSGCGVMQYTRA